MICKTEAVILRVVKFSESDAILTVYSKKFGKISLIVKGGFSPKSKKKTYLQESLIVEIVYYEKSTRDLQYLSDISLSVPFINYSKIPQLQCYAYTMIEIFRNVIVEEKIEDSDLYDLLKKCLIFLDKAPENPFLVWKSFHFELLRKIGFDWESESILQDQTEGYQKMTDFQMQKEAHKIYQDFSKHIDQFRIPKSWDILMEILR